MRFRVGLLFYLILRSHFRVGLSYVSYLTHPRFRVGVSFYLILHSRLKVSLTLAWALICCKSSLAL